MPRTCKAKTSHSALVPAPVVGSGKEGVRSDNPMDWIFDNPNGPLPNFGFGVLRKVYRGFENSARAFGSRKLRPVQGIDERGNQTSAITAFRAGTVLPRDAADVFDEPETLLYAFDAFTCAHESSLLVYVTLSYPHATRVHQGWEEARAFAYANFAKKRQLPVCLIQHRPGDAGSSNPPHVHLLIGPRQLDGTGFRAYARDLLTDAAQQVIFDEWREFVARWH